ncbi:hypothetical protein GJ496_005486 [Pomphorhynchus laevis]|nr:hypothetical protein GJ496_005486 [Pomphorhynchus laevis]
MEFLEQKYSWLFKFFDHSQNGHISHEDFVAKAERATEEVKEYFLTQENGQELVDEHLETIRNSQIQAYQNLFNGLAQQIDKDADGQINEDEWINFCKEIASYYSSNNALPSWFQSILEEYFTSVLDFDGNGAIDFYEMAFMGDAPVEVTWFCFDFLTNQGKEPLDKESFVNFTTNYFTSEDPSDPSSQKIEVVAKKEQGEQYALKEYIVICHLILQRIETKKIKVIRKTLQRRLESWHLKQYNNLFGEAQILQLKAIQNKNWTSQKKQDKSKTFSKLMQAGNTNAAMRVLEKERRIMILNSAFLGTHRRTEEISNDSLRSYIGSLFNCSPVRDIVNQIQGQNHNANLHHDIIHKKSKLRK